ncbi:polysaccharide deacetylase family protein [Camelliibacillus cellulosilyticus]|uniref:Polysaccharide deacetylase family protein n=1 Tax=Camelliibacillus cellulosilyticus TaxID=2174486 RepID=A0ABV9GL89_9BACL
MTESRKKQRALKTRKIFIKTSLILGLIIIVGFFAIYLNEKHATSVMQKNSVSVNKSHAGQPSPDAGMKKGVESPATKKHKGQTDKMIYLTFDDGPSSSTNEILDILQKYHAKATFFMLAPHMTEHPDVVKRIVADGHGTGLHGVTHNAKHFYQSKQTVVGEMDEAQQTLENITGVHSVLVRPPYGSVPYLIQPYRKALEAKGYKLWDWTIDSADWSMPSEKHVKNTIKQIKKVGKFDETLVVLMHDKPTTAKYLTELLDYLAEQGYHMERIDASIPSMHFNCYDRCHPLKT